MTDRTRRGEDHEAPARIDMGPLLRIAAWGAAAAGALAIAVFASRSEVGERRFSLAGNSVQSDAVRLTSAQALTRAAEAEREARRLNETVRTLAGDRDQLAARVATLERSLEDLTGSISLTRPTRKPALADTLLAAPSAGAKTPSSESASPFPTIAGTPQPQASGFGQPPLTPPATISTDAPAAGHAEAPSSEIPLPRPNPLLAWPPIGQPTAAIPPTSPAPGTGVAAQPNTAAEASGANKQRFGVDLGGASSIEGLRALWGRIKGGQSSPLLAELKPLVSVRDAAQPGSVELRLVAGPVPSALAASRLCAALATAGAACRAAAFEGQTLIP